ncbi:unnamed protein product, partial [marine sediment metagenome]
ATHVEGAWVLSFFTTAGGGALPPSLPSAVSV